MIYEKKMMLCEIIDMVCLLGVSQFVFASNKVTDEKLLVVYIRKEIRSLS